MESVEDRTMKLSCLPLFPQSLEIAKERRFRTLPPHYGYEVYTDVSNGRTYMTFQSGGNNIVNINMTISI
jgi:hypothetical protein